MPCHIIANEKLSTTTHNHTFKTIFGFRFFVFTFSNNIIPHSLGLGFNLHSCGMPWQPLPWYAVALAWHDIDLALLAVALAAHGSGLAANGIALAAHGIAMHSHGSPYSYYVLMRI